MIVTAVITSIGLVRYAPQKAEASDSKPRAESITTLLPETPQRVETTNGFVDPLAASEVELTNSAILYGVDLYGKSSRQQPAGTLSGQIPATQGPSVIAPFDVPPIAPIETPSTTAPIADVQQTAPPSSTTSQPPVSTTQPTTTTVPPTTAPTTTVEQPPESSSNASNTTTGPTDAPRSLRAQAATN